MTRRSQTVLLVMAAALGLAAWAAPAGARTGRAQVRTRTIDDECDVKYPDRIQAIAYDRTRHKRKGAARLRLEKGVALRQVSTMTVTFKGRRKHYHIWSWARGGKRQYFVLDRKVKIQVMYNGVWRHLHLTPKPLRQGARDNKLVLEFKIVR